VAIRRAAGDWAQFWAGHLDLVALAWETAELLEDDNAANARVDRAAEVARGHWESVWGETPVVVRSRDGPTDRPDGEGLHGRRQPFRQIEPVQLVLGTMETPSRSITKECPALLRLAFYQAAKRGPQHRPAAGRVVQTAHDRTRPLPHPATCAVARKLVARTWATLTTGVPYELRDLDGHPITRRAAKALAGEYGVPDEVRRRSRARPTATHRARLTR